MLIRESADLPRPVFCVDSVELRPLRGPSYTLNHDDTRTVLSVPGTVDPAHRKDIKDELILAPSPRPGFLL